MRFRTCYVINIGLRVHEMNLADIVDIMLEGNAGAYLFEAGNQRHEHEWTVWERVTVPDGKILVPGVISHSTPLVEHPELIAQRLVRYARIVGREKHDGGRRLRLRLVRGRGAGDPRCWAARAGKTG